MGGALGLMSQIFRNPDTDDLRSYISNLHNFILFEISGRQEMRFRDYVRESDLSISITPQGEPDEAFGLNNSLDYFPIIVIEDNKDFEPRIPEKRNLGGNDACEDESDEFCFVSKPRKKHHRENL